MDNQEITRTICNTAYINDLWWKGRIGVCPFFLLPHLERYEHHITDYIKKIERVLRGKGKQYERKRINKVMRLQN